jgi:hypothetical protein
MLGVISTPNSTVEAPIRKHNLQCHVEWLGDVDEEARAASHHVWGWRCC